MLSVGKGFDLGYLLEISLSSVEVGRIGQSFGLSLMNLNLQAI